MLLWREFSCRIDIRFDEKFKFRRCWSTLLEEISHEWIFLYARFIYIHIYLWYGRIYIHVYFCYEWTTKFTKWSVESCFLRRKKRNAKDEAIDQLKKLSPLLLRIFSTLIYEQRVIERNKQRSKSLWKQILPSPVINVSVFRIIFVCENVFKLKSSYQVSLYRSGTS